MYFESFSAAMTMDGHGVYVWSAYLIATAAIAMILIAPRRRERKFLKQLAGEIRRQQAHKDAAAESGTGAQ